MAWFPFSGDSGSGSRLGWRLTDSQITSVSGTTAGLVATFAKQPIQRAKWLKQTEASSRSFRSIVTETMTIHGWRGFFSGSVAAICRNVPHSALVYSFYPHLARLSASALRSQENSESFATRFVAGYATMIAATLVTHPMDTLRVRLSVSPTRTDLTSCLRKVYAESGVAGFYAGFGPTLLGAGPRGAIGFAIFETAKPMASDSFSPGIAKFLCGYVAGLVSETTVYPLDTVRRRQQALGAASPLTHLRVHDAIAYIVRHEGVAGLFKGVALNLVKNPAAVAVSFAVNDFVKDALGYGRQHDLRRDSPRPATAGNNKKPGGGGGAFFG